MMPPFLSTREEAKTKSVCVRYALSSFEDLNSAIRNLRSCFGFPYPEAIGYLNTITKAHRVRREHETLIDRLRQWAVFGNVDAVVWIDYEKANQRSGSFKVGPRDSVPFSRLHVERCANASAGHHGIEDEDMDGEWSGSEGEGDCEKSPRPAKSPAQGAAQRSTEKEDRDAAYAAVTANAQELANVAKGLGRRWANECFGAADLLSPRGSGERAVTPRSVPRTQPLSARGEGSTAAARLEATRAMQGKETILQMTIQEEVVPAYGSIYRRSMTPGPGHYGNPGAAALPLGDLKSFGRKPRGRLDNISARGKLLPGPGHYSEKPGLSEVKAKLGCMDRGWRPTEVMPLQSQKQIPFVSNQANARESYGIHGPHGPNALKNLDSCMRHVVGGSGSEPEYSFGKARRPW